MYCGQLQHELEVCDMYRYSKRHASVIQIVILITLPSLHGLAKTSLVHQPVETVSRG